MKPEDKIEQFYSTKKHILKELENISIEDTFLFAVCENKNWEIKTIIFGNSSHVSLITDDIKS